MDSFESRSASIGDHLSIMSIWGRKRWNGETFGAD
jgi:hypothetical protein